MRGLVSLVFCGTLLAVCSPLALADSVSVTGDVSFTPSSLTFAPPFATQTDTGIFGNFTGGNVNYMLGTVPYMDGLPQTEEAFTITDANGNVLAFYDQVNTPSQTTDGSGNLDVTLDETGYYTINGGAEMGGTFDVSFDGTSPSGASSNVQFVGTGELFQSTTIGLAPEPAPFLLMGTGFLALAGLLRERHRGTAVLK